MPSDETLALQSVAILSRAVATRQLSPVEILDAVAARIEAVEPYVHAFVTLALDQASEEARRRADQLACGRTPGVLEGIPVGVKDLTPTAGLRTTYGSRHFENHVPTFDGAEVERLRAAGAIIIGKTNTPAWGLKELCENLVTAATRNPWDLARTAGGSSGGAAAAVAAGYGPIAHGTDGAGSVRIPAAWCGTVGFKPSLGRIPVWPAHDLWAARVHVGCLGWRVADVAAMLTGLSGPDPRDPLSLDAPAEDFMAARDNTVSGLRLAWSEDLGFAAVDPDVRDVTRAAVRKFEELGAQIEEVPDPGWGDPSDWHRVIFRAAAATRLRQFTTDRPELLDDSVKDIISLGLQISAEQYFDALAERTLFYERARAFLAGYDGLLTPTMPCGAFRYNEPPPTIEGRHISETPGGRWPLVFSFNVTGWPAVTVPCGFTRAGLPVGLQIVTPWHEDGRCLSIAAAFESVASWHNHRPRVRTSAEAAETAS
jgi:Asp-tRNA(Asn)/Glu-tRNA(Gln) amidotransferase A subunit family amidase